MYIYGMSNMYDQIVHDVIIVNCKDSNQNPNYSTVS